jgi:hypothetical protein
MAETLGSLCDKLTIVKLKQYHSDDCAKTESLIAQEQQLCEEIDAFLSGAFSGEIAADKLTFRANKVYKKRGNELQELQAESLGAVLSELAKVNCDLWHAQEKVYEFETVPATQKDAVVKQLAALNLKRNQCVDAIDQALVKIVQSKGGRHVS